MSLRINLKKVVTVFLLFLLVCSNIIFVPSIIINVTRIFFIFFSGMYLVFYKGKLRKTLFHLLIYIYCFFSLFSCFFSPYFNMNLLFSTLQFILMTVLILNIDLITDKKIFFNKVLSIITVVIVFATIYSLLLKIFGSMEYLSVGYYENTWLIFFKQKAMGMSNDLGYSSFYNNPNIFGYYLLLALIYRLINLNKYKKKNNFIVLLIISIGILLANSRAVALLSLATIILYIFFCIKPKYRIFYIFICSILGLYLIYSLLSLNIAFDEMLTGRSILWEKMINSINNYPIFGIGFSASSKYVLVSSGSIVGSHNSYLNILCENGIVGFFIFIAILFIALKKVVKTLISDYKLIDRTYLIALIIYIEMIFYAFFENLYMIIDSRNFIWILSVNIMFNYAIHSSNKKTTV